MLFSPQEQHTYPEFFLFPEEQEPLLALKMMLLGEYNDQQGILELLLINVKMYLKFNYAIIFQNHPHSSEKHGESSKQPNST